MAFTIVGDAAMISGNITESRAAAVFTGGNTDDAYATDALAALAGGLDTVGTMIAWINTGDKTSTGAIFSFNDANVVEFLDFKIAAGKVAAACTDATVAQWATATTAVVIEPHKWYHVALKHDGQRPYIFVNGVKQALTDSVTTDLTDWAATLAGLDKGWIGASSIGGAGAVSEEFVGAISDVKYYNTTLTDAQILEDYKGAHLTTGCVAWYDMYDLLDKATGGGTYDISAVSDVYLTPTYNEFISRVRKFGALTADVAGMAESDGHMSVLFINAA